MKRFCCKLANNEQWDNIFNGKRKYVENDDNDSMKFGQWITNCKLSILSLDAIKCLSNNNNLPLASCWTTQMSHIQIEIEKEEEKENFWTLWHTRTMHRAYKFRPHTNRSVLMMNTKCSEIFLNSHFNWNKYVDPWYSIGIMCVERSAWSYLLRTTEFHHHSSSNSISV